MKYRQQREPGQLSILLGVIGPFKLIIVIITVKINKENRHN